MVDFNKRHLILTGRVHRFRICKIFFLRRILATGEGGTGEKFNLPNTCPKWTSWGALECHWSSDSEYINFLAVGALGAEIWSPEFPNRNSAEISKMAAADMKIDLDAFFLAKASIILKNSKKKFLFFFSKSIILYVKLAAEQESVIIF